MTDGRPHRCRAHVGSAEECASHVLLPWPSARSPALLDLTRPMLMLRLLSINFILSSGMATALSSRCP